MAKPIPSSADIGKLSKCKLVEILERAVEKHEDIAAEIRHAHLAANPVALAKSLSKDLKSIRVPRRFLKGAELNQYCEARLDPILSVVRSGLMPDSPELSAPILCSFLQLDRKLIQHIDDSYGTAGGRMTEAKSLLVEIARRNPELVLEEVRKIQDRDEPFSYRAEALLEVSAVLPESMLRELISEYEAKLDAAIEESKAVVEFDPKPTTRRSPDFSLHSLRWPLMEMLEYLGDPDYFWQLCQKSFEEIPTVHERTYAELLLKADRYEEAMKALPAFPTNGFHRVEIESTRRDILRAMGRRDEVVLSLRQQFERDPSEEALHAWQAELPDGEQTKARDMALEYLEKHHKKREFALSQMVEFCEIDRAAGMVRAAPDPALWNGDYWNILPSCAKALSSNYPREATIIYRSLIQSILHHKRSKAYGHGVRYLILCGKLAGKIASWTGLQDHTSFVESLREGHPKKRSFWLCYDDQ